MTLWDIATGCEFTMSKGGVVWIKGTPQGMGDRYVYCKTKVAKPARSGHGPVHRQRLLEQNQTILWTSCAPTPRNNSSNSNVEPS